MSGNGVEYDSAAAQHSAARLDALADRLESELHHTTPTLSPPPAGEDEVSYRAAHSLHSVASSYHTSATASIREIRGLATALRSHGQRLDHVESESAAGLGASR